MAITYTNESIEGLSVEIAAINAVDYSVKLCKTRHVNDSVLVYL